MILYEPIEVPLAKHSEKDFKGVYKYLMEELHNTTPSGDELEEFWQAYEETRIAQWKKLGVKD